MTSDDVFAIAGRTRHEWREAKKTLAALESQARKLREFLKILDSQLAEPSGLLFENQTFDQQFVPMGKHHYFKNSDFEKLTAQELQKLGEEIRQYTKKVYELRQELAKLEGEDNP